MNNNLDDSTNEAMENRLRKIENRLAGIEHRLNLQSSEADSEPDEVEITNPESGEDMEFRLGEKWFGKIGIVTFIISMFYLIAFPLPFIPEQLTLTGTYIISIIMIAFSFWQNENFKNLRGYITGGGFIILYLSTLALHFFSTTPLVENQNLIIGSLYLISFFAFLISLKQSSLHLTALSLLLFGIGSLVSNNPYLIFLSLAAGSFVVTFISNKYHWDGLLYFAIPATYFMHLLWFINNPLLGRKIAIVTDDSIGIIFIMLYMVIYGIGNLKFDTENNNTIIKSSLNLIFGYALFILVSLTTNKVFSAPLNLVAAIIFLIYASLFWKIQTSKVSTFLYSMAGYGALSIAIILQFPSPDYFLWLCWQSLAVVSTALWFRSRIIVVANFFIFIFVLIGYFTYWQGATLGSLGFGIVALINARIMNWQKERLALQTEKLRIGYLFIAGFTIPYILYDLIPGQFVGISWIVLAFVYYIVGKIINNKRYRLMATITIIGALVYIFIFGIVSSDSAYKILSFIIVSFTLIILSIVYAKTKQKEKPE